MSLNASMIRPRFGHELAHASTQELKTWEFPKIRGTLFWGPYNRILLFRVLY